MLAEHKLASSTPFDLDVECISAPSHANLPDTLDRPDVLQVVLVATFAGSPGQVWCGERMCPAPFATSRVGLSQAAWAPHRN